MAEYVLAIDQGTTSTRALLFDESARIVAVAQEPFEQHFPRPGEVEHDPEDLWTTTVSTVRGVLTKAACGPEAIAAIGIANQRETVLVWERATGRPIHRAIVWQDRRTADECAALRGRGHEALVSERTGLLLDPYFSATKIAWILDHVEGARARAEAGDLAFGTVDTFLLWRLTGGRVHATDATNASRTSLYDIRAGDWDPELLELFRVPRGMLPEVRDSAGEFGISDPALLGGGIGIAGVAGDQQAATLGQGCFEPGMMKATYGTGCFLVANIGAAPVASRNRLLTTVVWQHRGERAYGLEGSIFIAGAGVQWLRDELSIISSAQESGRLAAEADPEQPVYVVPAFTGLGAPWWDAGARGAIFGLTRGSGRAELAPGHPRVGGVPDPGPHRRGAGRRGGGHGAPGRRRDGRVGLDHAVSRRRARSAGGPAGWTSRPPRAAPRGSRATTPASIQGRRSGRPGGNATGGSPPRWRATPGSASSAVGATRCGAPSPRRLGVPQTPAGDGRIGPRWAETGSGRRRSERKHEEDVHVGGAAGAAKSHRRRLEGRKGADGSWCR